MNSITAHLISIVTTMLITCAVIKTGTNKEDRGSKPPEPLEPEGEQEPDCNSAALFSHLNSEYNWRSELELISVNLTSKVGSEHFYPNNDGVAPIQPKERRFYTFCTLCSRES